jgi:hypothetical protein
LAFIVRVYLLDDADYNRLCRTVDLMKLRKSIYMAWEHIFETKGCVYNLHVFLAHADLLRAKGPLTSTSAFAFEGFLGQLRNNIEVGTTSTPTQAISNLFLARAGTSKRCSPRKLKISTSYREGARARDDLIVTSSGGFFKLTGRLGGSGTDYFGVEAITRKFEPPWLQLDGLNFDDVGVRAFDGFKAETTIIRRNDVVTKAVICDGAILKIERHVLLEHD